MFKRITIVLTLSLLCPALLWSQKTVTIGSQTLNDKAVLMLVSDTNDQGFILPKVNSRLDINATAAEAGMLVYDAAEDGIYFWDGTNWISLIGGSSIDSIDELTDVSSSGAIPGQVLKWNGSQWVPETDIDEIQLLSFDASQNLLSISNGNNVDLTTLLNALQAGEGIEITDFVIRNTGDADADPSNEIQDITFNTSTNELSISGGSTVTLPSGGTDADADPTNEIQDISLSGTSLSITSGSTIDLGPIIPAGGTDDQNLILTGDLLSIEGGTGTVDLAGYINDADADPSNEIQDITFNTSTNELSISGGSTVTLPSGGTDADADPTNEIQDISLSGTSLSITSGSTIDLGPIIPAGGTDDQNLVLTGDVLSIEGGTGTVDLAGYINDADADPSNEIQDITFNTSTNELSISGGSTVTLPSGGTDADADPTNEIQDISLSGTSLSITSGSTIDLGPIIPAGGTDDQNLVLTGDVLSIEGGTGTVDLAGYVDDADADPANEIQDISLSGTSISITSGSTIDLGPIIPAGGTDDQNLVLTGDVLSIEGGTGTVDLSGYINDADSDPTNEIDVTTQTGLLVGDGAVVSGLTGTTSGQVLKWDGASWAPGSDETGSGPWSSNTDGLYYDAGNVSVGTTSNATARMTIDHNSTIPDPQLLLTENEDDYARLTFQNTVNDHFWTIAARNSDTPTNERFNLYNSELGDLFIINGEGKVGIGPGLAGSRLTTFIQDANTELPTGIYQYNGYSGTGTAYGIFSTMQNSTSPTKIGIYTVGEDYNTLQGDLAVGKIEPASTLDVQGGRWNVFSSEGDFRIGNDTHRLKIGVATGGGGAGDTRIQVVGGTNRMMLGGGANTVLTINENDIGVGTPTPSAKFNVQTNSTIAQPHVLLTEDGADFARLTFENTNSDRFWTIAGFSHNSDEANDRLNFYNSVSGDVMSISGSGQVGIGQSPTPSTKLSVDTSTERVGLNIQQNYDQNDQSVGAYFLNFGASTNIKFGVFTSIINGSGSKYGNYTYLEQGANDVSYGHRLNIFNNGTSPGYGIFVNHSGTGSGTDYGVYVNGEDRNYFSGDIQTAGEVNRTSTGSANLVPIAYGNVSSTGALNTNASSDNLSVTKTSDGVYRINIAGESYQISSSYSTVVSPVNILPSLVGTSSFNGDLMVYTYDATGTRADRQFHFVVYKK